MHTGIVSEQASGIEMSMGPTHHRILQKRTFILPFYYAYR